MVVVGSFSCNFCDAFTELRARASVSLLVAVSTSALPWMVAAWLFVSVTPWCFPIFFSAANSKKLSPSDIVNLQLGRKATTCCMALTLDAIITFFFSVWMNVTEKIRPENWTVINAFWHFYFMPCQDTVHELEFYFCRNLAQPIFNIAVFILILKDLCSWTNGLSIQTYPAAPSAPSLLPCTRMDVHNFVDRNKSGKSPLMSFLVAFSLNQKNPKKQEKAFVANYMGCSITVPHPLPIQGGRIGCNFNIHKIRILSLFLSSEPPA